MEIPFEPFNKVDATWIQIGRPFCLLKSAPTNPFQWVTPPDQKEPMAASFYPDGQLQYLISCHGEVLFLEHRKRRGYYYSRLGMECYKDDGWHFEADHFEVETKNITSVEFPVWVKKCIDKLWEAASTNSIINPTGK